MKFFKNIFKNKNFEHKIDEDKFNEYQIRELKLGLEKGLDVDKLLMRIEIEKEKK